MCGWLATTTCCRWWIRRKKCSVDVGDIVVSTLALALGLFSATSPLQAAQLWGSERLKSLTPGRKTWFLRGYRALGVMLSLAGVLMAIDSIPFKR